MNAPELNTCEIPEAELIKAPVPLTQPGEEPAIMEPGATEPGATESGVTEPAIMEPGATEPVPPQRKGLRLPQGPELRFKRPPFLAQLSLKRRPGLWLSLLLVLIFLAGLWRWSWLSQLMDSQHLARRWQAESETPYAQATAYFESEAALSEEDIYSFRQKADQALIDAGLEAPEGGGLYLDAWCGRSELSLSTERAGAAVKAQALALGGDWFAFHPLPLSSGVYLGAEDLMHDRVVLSRSLAFDLFGAVDVAGLELTIEGRPYLVAGVVELPDDKFTSQLKLNQSWIFVYADQLPDLKFTCYELVMADPLDGFAASRLREVFPEAQVVENSSRFQLKYIWQLTRHFAQSRIAEKGIAFPWWENASRVVEARLALLLAVLAVAALPPLGYSAYWLIRLVRWACRRAGQRIRAWRER